MSPRAAVGLMGSSRYFPVSPLSPGHQPIPLFHLRCGSKGAPAAEGNISHCNDILQQFPITHDKKKPFN
jgi:hypothetical protein